MACYISFRDVYFHATTDGVVLRVWTDVPCRVRVRISKKQPWSHIKQSRRRGLNWKEDLRFCFTVFSDISQYEEGSTLVHSFYFTDWPVCETRFFYFYGWQNGEVCLSTSPIFQFHNEGLDPEPPPPPPAEQLLCGYPNYNYPRRGYSLNKTLVQFFNPASSASVITKFNIARHNANINSDLWCGVFRPLGAFIYHCTKAWYLGTSGTGWYTKSFDIAGTLQPGDQVGFYGAGQYVRYTDEFVHGGRVLSVNYGNRCQTGLTSEFNYTALNWKFNMNFYGYPQGW